MTDTSIPRRWPRLHAWLATRLARSTRIDDALGSVVKTHWRGRLLTRARHENGRPHGPSESWWPSGAKRTHGAHKDGQRDGDWFEFGPDGSLDRARTGLYRDGLRIAGIRGFNEWLGSP